MSQSPEEQPSPGVLGRIGSWFSPWRGKTPTGPSENDSPTREHTLRSEGEEETPPVREEQWEEEEEEEEEQGSSSNPNQLSPQLSRDIFFLCEEEDATQSAHRDGPLAASGAPAGGGPTEERTGQGSEREESSNGPPASGSPASEKNASHLTHLSSSSEHSDQAHTQPEAAKQAQTGRKLHVYLEETSVTHSGQDTCAVPEVVCTRVKGQSLQVVSNSKTQSPKSAGPLKSSTPAENKRTVLKPTLGTQSHYTALVGVSLKSRKDAPLEPETEDTEADSMGRKNTPRRKSKKNSQGAGGSSSRENTPTTAQPVPEDFPTSDNPQGKSAVTQLGEASVNPSPKHKAASHVSPETSPTTGKQLPDSHDSDAAIAATLLRVVDGKANMEDDDSLYKVERRTETPESKRRSVKVSRSEVKFYSKKLLVNADSTAEETNQGFESGVKNTKDEAKPKPEVNARLQDVKKMDAESKPVVGRIADRINIFEGRAVGSGKNTSQSPRSADVSPSRTVTKRLKAEFGSSDQRSKSAERYGSTRSSSASPDREKLKTVKERARNFAPTHKPAPSQPSAMTGMSQKSSLSAAAPMSKSQELDIQGKQDRKEKMQQTTVITEIRCKPDMRDTTAVRLVIPASKQQTDSQTKVKEALETAELPTKPELPPKPNRVETDSPAIGSGDVDDLTDSKGPGRAGARANKRRKSKELTSPISPNSENKPGHCTDKQEVSASKQEKGADTEETASPTTQLIEAVTLPSDKRPVGSSSETQSPSESSQQAVRKASEASDKHNKTLHSSLGMDNMVKPVKGKGGLTEASVNTVDKPDSAVCSRGTKKPIDKDPGVSPQKEERAGGHTSEDSSETSDSAPLLVTYKQHLIEKTPVVQGTPVEHPTLDNQAETKNKENAKQSNNKDMGKAKPKDTGVMNHVEDKDVEKVVQSEKRDTEHVREIENKGKVGTSASSPLPLPYKQHLIEKTPVENPRKENQAKTKNKENVNQSNKKDVGKPKQKDTDIINHTENKDIEKVAQSEKRETEKIHEIENQVQQRMPSDKNTTKGMASASGQEDIPETRVAASDRKDEPKLVKDIAKAPEPASEKTVGSARPTQTQPVSEMLTAHPHPHTQANKTVSDARPVGPPQGEAASNVPEWQTQSAQTPGIQTQPAQTPGIQTQPAVTTAQPQANSVGREKTEKCTDDSQAHGAVDVAQEFPHSERAAGAARAAEKATVPVKAANEATVPVKAANETTVPVKTANETTVPVKAANETPPPTAVVPTQTGKMAEEESSVKEPIANSGPKSGQYSAIESEVKSSTEVIKVSSSMCKESNKTPAIPVNDSSLAKGTVKTIQSSSANGATATNTAVTVERKANDKTQVSVVNEPSSPVVNGDLSPPRQAHTVNHKPESSAHAPKAATTKEATKLSSRSVQHSSLNKIPLPRGLSEGDPSKQRDAPSSWLDVDFPKKKIKSPEPRELVSSGSESNLLDTSGDLDDDEFVEKIKNLCAPFSLPPRKHNYLRTPQPAFALPAIREDRFEKTFDPEEFQFGLRKKPQFSMETSSSILTKLQSTETKAGLKPARASLADRSMLLNSLDVRSRLREKTTVEEEEEEEPEEKKDEQIKVKSRLEGSCVLSSLTTFSNLRGKRNGVQAQADGSNFEDLSPTEAPQFSPPLASQPLLPSPTLMAPFSDALSGRAGGQAVEIGVQAVEAVVSDSGPPLPSFNDFKLPDYLEKYLPRELAKPERSAQEHGQLNTEITGRMSKPVPGGGGAGLDVLLPDGPPPRLPGLPLATHPTRPQATPTRAVLHQPRLPATPIHNIRVSKGSHRRPGKMVLFQSAQFGGQMYEICSDMADATSLQFSALISVRVVRGCWVLYENPYYHGRSVALEEGCIELTNLWEEPESETQQHADSPMFIGSIRLVVSDYSVPHIDLFTDPEGHGRVTPYHDDTVEIGSFGIPHNTGSIKVHSGVWLVFSDPGYQGMLAVLEEGEYPLPETWGFPSPFIGSLRPLKMGGFKVENPNEVKAVVYQKPDFEGACLEIDGDVFYFGDGDSAADGVDKLTLVGSLKIIGGLWVGYSQPGFEGQQHVLEEGEYPDWSDWVGGPQLLLSLRPIVSDFLAPHLKMFSDVDFGTLGVNIDLTVPVANVEETGYGPKTQSLDVIGGVWVVFEEPGFCGEAYVLEKGLYACPEDWGSLRPRIASAMPVVMDDLETCAKFKVQLFSDPGFQGLVLVLEDSAASLQPDFTVASCKVLAGSWLAFEGQDFTDNMYVLEVGSYPDLKAMGCVQPRSSILSLQTTGFEFSLPSITLCERVGLRGKRVVLTAGSVNQQLAGGCARVQSVLVQGGMWILYEGINYRGAQILLRPGEVPEWRKLSSWQKIGSLRPLIQKQVHFHLKNKGTGLLMSVTGDLDDVKLMRVQEMEETGGLEQIWSYQNGHLYCRLLEECCLSPSGSVTMAGSRLGLNTEPGTQPPLWSITPDGFILYTASPDLLLEVKGGHNYDKNQVILNTRDEHKLTQRWNVEVL